MRASRNARNVCLISALGVVLISAPPILLAAAETGTPPHEAQDARRIRADSIGLPEAVIQGKELESILGREIRTSGEEDVGRIIDLLADRQGHVQAAVVELGGFLGIGTRKIAVEWSALRFETKGKQPIVILDMSRDHLRLAPEYKPSEPVIVRKAAQ